MWIPFNVVKQRRVVWQRWIRLKSSSSVEMNLILVPSSCIEHVITPESYQFVGVDWSVVENQRSHALTIEHQVGWNRDVGEFQERWEDISVGSHLEASLTWLDFAWPPEQAGLTKSSLPS